MSDIKTVLFVGNWESWISIEDILELSNISEKEFLVSIIGNGPKMDQYQKNIHVLCFLVSSREKKPCTNELF